jgi:lauroyl/myristoyl acyltransferase
MRIILWIVAGMLTVLAVLVFLPFQILKGLIDKVGDAIG